MNALIGVVSKTWTHHVNIPIRNSNLCSVEEVRLDFQLYVLYI